MSCVTKISAMQTATKQEKAPKGVWRVIAASTAGTMIEWYDFFIFGSLATILSTQFYPPGSATAAFLKTLATFAVGFAVRPLGALFFGRIGDLVGRKFAFLTTLLLMGGSTAAIGLLPGYSSIGIAAPIILVILRMLQGLALGGEYGGAAVYVAEHVPDSRRGFYTSFIQTTASMGLFTSLIVILVTSKLAGRIGVRGLGLAHPVSPVGDPRCGVVLYPDAARRVAAVREAQGAVESRQRHRSRRASIRGPSGRLRCAFFSA